MRPGVAMIVAGALLAGCSDKGGSGEFAGIANWSFTSTTRADVTIGRCQPTTLDDGRKATWCVGNPTFQVGSKRASVDLYFEGTEPTARLIEIQLSIRGCIEDEVVQFMIKNFGPPVDERKSRAYWKNQYLWAAALVPQRESRCIVHLLPLSEAKEIARIKQI
jgi:hypothetical protein